MIDLLFFIEYEKYGEMCYDYRLVIPAENS